MLSMCTGYRRSTRYKAVPNPSETPEQQTPRYMALHEYDTTNFPGDQIKKVVATEWSKRVIQGAQKFERDTWEFIASAGKTESKL